MKASDRSHRACETFLPVAIIVALVLIAYIPVMRGGFIWDDDYHLVRNPCIIGPLGFKEIWSSARAVYYPLVWPVFGCCTNWSA